MRAVDAKVLEELEMLYVDKDCFASLHNWFGIAETYWTNLERLLLITDQTKKLYPFTIEEITVYNKRIIDLFHQTKNYVVGWDSKQMEKSNLPQKITLMLQPKIGSILSSCYNLN